MIDHEIEYRNNRAFSYHGSISLDYIITSMTNDRTQYSSRICTILRFRMASTILCNTMGVMLAALCSPYVLVLTDRSDSTFMLFYYK